MAIDSGNGPSHLSASFDHGKDELWFEHVLSMWLGRHVGGWISDWFSDCFQSEFFDNAEMLFSSTRQALL